MAEDGSDEYGRGGEPLTALERSRLRPGVDPAALERLLAALDSAGYGAMRRFVVGQFFTRPTLDDVRAAHSEVGARERLAEVERWYPVAEAEARALWRRKRAEAVLFAWHGRLTDPAEQLAAALIRADVPPGAPDEVRARWDAVEPDGEAASRRALASAPLEPGVGARIDAPGPRPRRWCDGCGTREATTAWVRGEGTEPATLVPISDATVVYDEDDIPPEIRRAILNLQAEAAAPRADEGRESAAGASWTAAPMVQYFCDDCAHRREERERARGGTE